MASRIAGITVEIGGDTLKLKQALSEVEGKIKQTQRELKDVERLLIHIILNYLLKNKNS